MNQDLKTNILIDNNNEQQPKEGSEEGFEEESEEGSKEVSEESSEDSSEEDQEGLTVEKLSRVVGKKLTPPLPKPNPELVQVPRALSLDLDLDFELESNVEQALMTTLKEVKIAKPDLFYEDRKKLKVYFVQTGTYLVLNDYLLFGDIHKVL
ncbi:hypothetical protein B7463_g2383, partial [Scytalidium lignicola]